MGKYLYIVVYRTYVMVQGIKKRKRSRMVFDETTQVKKYAECVHFSNLIEFEFRNGRPGGDIRELMTQRISG